MRVLSAICGIFVYDFLCEIVVALPWQFYINPHVDWVT